MIDFSDANKITITRNVLEPILKNFRSVTVTFLKLNGEKRVMNCTLHPDLLPAQTDLEEYTNKGNNVHVWDLDNDAWRSFHVERVMNVSFNL